MNRLLTLVILLITSIASFAQPKTDAFLKTLIQSKASPLLQHVLANPDSFQYQIIYTQIDRDKNNVPHFKNYYYNVDKNSYYNPASTVKLPTALVALEKLNTLSAKGINKETTMLTDSSYEGQTSVINDSSAQNYLPSIAQYLRKIFLVSDNDAYNRLYEFDGQQTLNQQLWNKGYKDIRIVRRFVGATEEQNRHTNGIRFINDSKTIYTQQPAYNPLQFDYSKQILVGKGRWNANDSLINEPMDFTKHNNFPLEDLQQILQSVMFPESVPTKQRFNLTKDDYSFLYQYMSEYPSENKYPHYDTSEYFNSYCKFFMFKADKKTPPSNIRIFNKPGWSYGYLTDAAYIVDFKNKTEFIVSAVIYVNSDGILNDNKYEYDSIGYPYFKEIGNIIYNYELQRKRKNVPDLSKFNIVNDYR